MIPLFYALERQQSEHQEHREMPPIDEVDPGLG